MRFKSREQYVNLIENGYFGNMAAGQPQLIMPLLAEDAVLTGLFGANHPRRVSHDGRPGTESFLAFLSALQADFELRYSNFFHIVDVDLERSACTFRLEIIARDVNSNIGIRTLQNCNFFQFKDGLIRAVTAYFASPSGDVDPWETLALASDS